MNEVKPSDLFDKRLDIIKYYFGNIFNHLAALSVSAWFIFLPVALAIIMFEAFTTSPSWPLMITGLVCLSFGVGGAGCMADNKYRNSIKSFLDAAYNDKKNLKTSLEDYKRLKRAYKNNKSIEKLDKTHEKANTQIECIEILGLVNIDEVVKRIQRLYLTSQRITDYTLRYSVLKVVKNLIVKFKLGLEELANNDNSKNNNAEKKCTYSSYEELKNDIIRDIEETEKQLKVDYTNVVINQELNNLEEEVDLSIKNEEEKQVLRIGK